MKKKMMDTSLLLALLLAMFGVSTKSNIYFLTESNETPIAVEEMITSRNEGVTAGVCAASYALLEEAGTQATLEKVQQEIVAAGNEGEEVTTVSAELGEIEETTSNRWSITLTQEERDLLAKIVWLEAQGESVEGQEAVVEVIFNRMVSADFPNSLYDVVSQTSPDLQFSSWPYVGTAYPTEKEYASIDAVLSGNTQILRDDTVYFSTTMQTSNLDTKIGNHYFCY